MTQPIVMPKLGLTMTEGLLASWRVKPGDRVRQGDVLFVVETEKIATDIEAPGEGEITAITVAPGSTVPVGAVVATWTGQALPAEPPAEPPAAPVPAPPADGRRVIATPLARRLARAARLDPAAIAGSGPRGRIKARDIEAALAAPPAPP
ncbi:MAG: E3 binding domain-containing protein, partial [Rhodospirillales bacterium]|nr:E3 binding domain-containing protein [Rhodospirillales bacterium]